jgi:hypothetical protein
MFNSSQIEVPSSADLIFTFLERSAIKYWAEMVKWLLRFEVPYTQKNGVQLMEQKCSKMWTHWCAKCQDLRKSSHFCAKKNKERSLACNPDRHIESVKKRHTFLDKNVSKFSLFCFKNHTFILFSSHFLCDKNWTSQNVTPLFCVYLFWTTSTPHSNYRKDRRLESKSP